MGHSIQRSFDRRFLSIRRSQQGLTGKRRTLCLFIFLSVVGAISIPLHAGSVKIIANPSIKANAITIEELKGVFLEETQTLRAGSRVEPVLQEAGQLHTAFVTQYLGRDAGELHTYYLGLAFTGKGSIPKEFHSDSEVIAYVAKTPGAIGYVTDTTSAPGVKTLVVIAGNHVDHRQLLTRVDPEYPEVLERLHVGGTVRLCLIIAPNGTVESASLLGGNPILGEAAVRAATKWIYTPAAKRTKLEVTIPFSPGP